MINRLIFTLLCTAIIFGSAQLLSDWQVQAMAGQFGTYTDAYIARKAGKDQAARWKQLCNSGQRLQAEQEAYSAGKYKPFVNESPCGKVKR